MNIEVIKASKTPANRSRVSLDGRMRVAAYCRVSTDDEEQLKSYDSMVRYYTEMIGNNPDWELAGIYADKAITGTKVDKREEFQRLINDCLSGKVDMVLAKSLSRFARNTLDTLKYVRMLKEKSVAVYFESEKINTLKDGEFLMTILSSVAQQEVENTSANVKKGLKMKMRRGEMVGFQGCLGYDYDPVTKTLSVNEEGAEVVRYIFSRYNAGVGTSLIARELNERGLKTIRGNDWSTSSVMGIVKNEKYKGDLLLGKTFTVDPISKRRLDNFGEEDRFYIKDHHEPIVSEETYDKAQSIRKKRNINKFTPTTGKREKFSRQYSLSCMVDCGYCGYHLSRRCWHSGTKYSKTIWQCSKATKSGKKSCPNSRGITEQVIEKAFVESYRLMSDGNRNVIDEFLARTEEALKKDDHYEMIAEATKEEKRLREKRRKLLDGYMEGTVQKDIYEEMDFDLVQKLASVDARLKYLKQEAEGKGELKDRINEFRMILDKNVELEEFDRGIFESVVERVIVGGYDESGNVDPYKITFVYKTGFKDDIGDAKRKYTEKSSVVGKTEILCSNLSNEETNLCSDFSNNACGDGRAFTANEQHPIERNYS